MTSLWVWSIVNRFVNKPNPRIQQSQSNAQFNNRLANSELCNEPRNHTVGKIAEIDCNKVKRLLYSKPHYTFLSHTCEPERHIKICFREYLFYRTVYTIH